MFIFILIGYLNDIWVYPLNHSTWIWIGGSKTVRHMGVYGEKGEMSGDYLPASRMNTLAAYDNSSRTVWLFGDYWYVLNKNKNYE